MRLSRERATVIATAAVLFTPLCCRNDDAQRPSVPAAVTIEVSCAGCVLESRELITIGGQSGRPTVDARVASSGDSLLAVAPLSGTGGIGIFGLDGLLRRSIDLPNDWRAVAALEYLPNGELIALGRDKLARLSADGKLLRELTVPLNTHRFSSNDSKVVVNSELRTRDGLGFPLHLMSWSGGIERSFGSDDPTVVPRSAFEWRRRLARSHSGGIWSVNPDTYRMELWNIAKRGPAQLLKQIARGRWWDSASAGSNAEFARERPKGEVIAVWEDRNGLLWVQLKLAASQWRPISPEEMERRRQAPFRLSEYDEFFDTVIEVLDPSRGELVASRTVSGVVGILLEGGLFAKWIQTGDEEYALRISRLSLSGWIPR